MHTSTVTVAVIDDQVETNPLYDRLSENDFRIEWFSGTGKGGQHRNKHQNSCRMYHIPTGLMEARQGRKRETNLREAKAALLLKLEEMKANELGLTVGALRKEQVGSGMRGDKIRTYCFQKDQIIDHQSNTKISLKKVLRGNMDVFWNIS